MTSYGEGDPALTGPGTWVKQKDKAELLVKLLRVLPPVSHILSPSQVLLTSKGTPRRAPLCRVTAQQQHQLRLISAAPAAPPGLLTSGNKDGFLQLEALWHPPGMFTWP